MTRVLVIAVLLVASIAHADHARTFSIDVVTAGAPAWQVDAIGVALTADLADDQLRVGAKPDVAIHAELGTAQLRYTITYLGTRVLGVIELRGLDRRGLAGTLRDAIHNITQPIEGNAVPGPPAAIGAPGGLGGALALLALFALVLAVPLALGRGQLRALRATRRVGLAIIAIAAFGVALIAFGDRVPELGGVAMLAGGLAWGAFAAVVFPHVVPALPGLHRVEHDALTGVLRAWLGLAIQRIVIAAALLAPLGAILWLVGGALDLPLAITVGVIAPLVGLAARLWWRAIVEVTAARLDRELVDGDASAAQPWHASVRGYLVGYLNRNALEVDEPLLARVRFLPGKDDRIVVYGGGLTHTRVVIGRAILEMALAPYGRPHDYATPRLSTLHWTVWNAGLVMPTAPGSVVATREQRKPHVTVEDGDPERIALGEPPTMSGIIEPTGLDPRKSYRPGEDRAFLDWDPGEEYDGTDAGDKDFLFGVLVHALGMMQRHEDRTATLGLARQQWLRKLVRPAAAIRTLLARQTTPIADSHVALGGARPHLIQYLAWRLWRRDDLLTARAYAPELEVMSREIAQLDANTNDPELRRRLDYLEAFGSAAPRHRSRWQRLALAATVLAGATAVTIAVVQAISYHSIYVDRMTHDERPSDGKPK